MFSKYKQENKSYIFKVHIMTRETFNRFWTFELHFQFIFWLKVVMLKIDIYIQAI